MAFSVGITANSGETVNTQGLTLRPLGYSAAATGGPTEARVAVGGDWLACLAALEWLAYRVVIRNGNGTAVWSGMVTGVEVQTPGARIGLTLDDMRNRILVDYTYDDAEGVSQAADTGWLQDDVSAARYGVREERVSLADAPQAQAEQKRATWLAQVRLPVGSIEPDGGRTDGADGVAGATLLCSGLWGTLEWRYFAETAGRVVYDEGETGEHLLGWGVTSNLIGFRNGAIHDLGARLGNLAAGGKVVVAGSGSNNGTLTVEGAGDGEQVVQTSTSTSFEAADDVRDAVVGLSRFQADQMVRVEGSSANNNGFYWVKTTGAQRIEISSGVNSIQNAAAGPTITLTQGHSAAVGETVALERPGANVTLAALGSKIAQSFAVPSAGGDWAAYEVLVRAKRVGSPADGLQVGLWTDAAGAPGVQLAAATIAGGDMPTSMDWVTANLGIPPTLTGGNTYWIVVERTGSNAPDACYAVGVQTETEAAYADGVLRIWNGSAWAARWEDGDLPFQVWGQVETSKQIERMVQSAGQFLAGAVVVDASTIWKRQWRDGTRRALAEIEELMEAGAAGTNRQYVATVTPERMAMVRLEPTAQEDDPIYSALTGTWRLAQGGPWEEGVLPVGRWVQVGDLPLAGMGVAGLSRFFCERADYDVESGRLTPEPRGRRLPWDI